MVASVRCFVDWTALNEPSAPFIKRLSGGSVFWYFSITNCKRSFTSTNDNNKGYCSQFWWHELQMKLLFYSSKGCLFSFFQHNGEDFVEVKDYVIFVFLSIVFLIECVQTMLDAKTVPLLLCIGLSGFDSVFILTVQAVVNILLSFTKILPNHFTSWSFPSHVRRGCWCSLQDSPVNTCIIKGTKAEM